MPILDSNRKNDFSTDFDRLFLSNEPLRYQDNVAFLEDIPIEELNTEEKELVRTKIIQFLSLENHNREYAPDSIHTGVASEIAFLRLQAIQILAEVGTMDDIEFIRNLADDLEGEHPLFQVECKKAIQNLNEG
jgi:HEAT repeat protein